MQLEPSVPKSLAKLWAKEDALREQLYNSFISRKKKNCYSEIKASTPSWPHLLESAVEKPLTLWSKTWWIRTEENERRKGRLIFKSFFFLSIQFTPKRSWVFLLGDVWFIKASMMDLKRTGLTFGCGLRALYGFMYWSAMQPLLWGWKWSNCSV